MEPLYKRLLRLRAEDMNALMFQKLINRLKDSRHFDMRQISRHTECGAAMCLIGHTLIIAGFKIHKTVPHISGTSILLDNRNPLYNPDRYDIIPSRSDYRFIDPTTNTSIDSPYNTAMNLLGLTDYEASVLFNQLQLTTPKKAVQYLKTCLNTGEIYPHIK